MEYKNYTLKTDSKEINKFFDYVKAETSIAHFEIKRLKIKTEEFFNENYCIGNEDIIKEFENFSFYDIKNYNYKKNDNKLFALITNSSQMKTDLIELLKTGKTRKNKYDFNGLERQVSPPIESFKYIGVSKLNITPSGRSYGTLFD